MVLVLMPVAGGMIAGCGSDQAQTSADVGTAVMADADGDEAAAGVPTYRPVAAPKLAEVTLDNGQAHLSSENTSVVLRSKPSPADAAEAGWEARLNQVSGQLQVDEQQQLSGLSLEIDTTAVEASDAELKDYLGSNELLNAAEFSTARFEATGFEPSGEAVGNGRVMHVTGNLTLAGKTQEITAPAVVHVQDGQVAASISIQLDRDAFGMAPYQEDVQNTLQMAIEIGPQQTLQ